jgi:hypothetical protein
VRNCRALAALALCLALAASAGAGSSLNRVQVRAQPLLRSLHLRVSYWLEAPAGCPAAEPRLPADPLDEAALAAYEAEFARWLSPFCEPYVNQEADVTLVVSRPGARPRAAYLDDIGGLGLSGPAYGAAVDFRVPYSLFRGCRPGRYAWAIVVRDPYRRAGYTNATARVGAFRVRRCL